MCASTVPGESPTGALRRSGKLALDFPCFCGVGSDESLVWIVKAFEYNHGVLTRMC
jgi:hypothetical protein